MVKAVVPQGKKAGIHIGRIAVRKTGSFNIQTMIDGKSLVVQGINHSRCRVSMRVDAWRQVWVLVAGVSGALF